MVRAFARLPREARGPVLVVGVVVLGMLGLMIAAIVAIGVVLDRRRSPGS